MACGCNSDTASGKPKKQPKKQPKRQPKKRYPSKKTPSPTSESTKGNQPPTAKKDRTSKPKSAPTKKGTNKLTQGGKSVSVSSVPTNRITQKNLLLGIQQTSYQGRHHKERKVGVVGANIKTPGMVHKNEKLDLHEDHVVPHKSGRLDPKAVAENEFMARSSDMRGKKSAKMFRGSSAQVFQWNPATLGRPDLVGGMTSESGAYTGGFVGEKLRKTKKSDYVQEAGYQTKSFQTVAGGEALARVNPFAVQLKVKGRDLRVK